MLYVVGGNDDTPRKKVTNPGGRTTIAQDPSNHYSGPNLNNVNVNARSTSTPKSSGGSTAPAASAPVSSGGGGYDGGYDSGGGGGGFDWAAYLAELQAQARARAEEAYKRNMERIATAYNSASANLKSNFDSTKERLGVARDNSMNDVNQDAESSLRQAYINNMLTKKNLNQRLSAMGYNGGATESTMAQLANNYGNSRTGINETLNKNITDLDTEYGNNLASALQSYNNAMSDLDLQRMSLEMEAENARQAAEASYSSSLASMMGGDSGYLAALQGVLASQNAYAYSPTEATNSFVPANVQQAASASSDSNNYAKYLQQALFQASNGRSASNIKNDLFNAFSNGDLDFTSLYNILKQLKSA